MRRLLSTLARNPRILCRQFNRYWNRFQIGKYNRNGVEIADEDWDNLLLLDACRFDLFKETATLPGELSPIKSLGTDTVQFLKSNLMGRDLRDTVYVTANPQFHKIREELDCEFHDVIDLWRVDWDDTIQTVRPEVTASATLQATEEYPNKRLFVHFNQPHVPFIGEAGKENFSIEEIIDHPLPFWQQPMAGVWDVSDSEIWDAYRENLDSVIPYVRDLLNELVGRTVVTSDHGNMIGERAEPIPIREYGHPRWIYTEELVTVPWLVRESSERKTIQRGTGTGSVVTSARVKERLESLGYT